MARTRETGAGHFSFRIPLHGPLLPGLDRVSHLVVVRGEVADRTVLVVPARIGAGLRRGTAPTATVVQVRALRAVRHEPVPSGSDRRRSSPGPASPRRQAYAALPSAGCGSHPPAERTTRRPPRRRVGGALHGTTRPCIPPDEVTSEGPVGQPRASARSRRIAAICSGVGYSVPLKFCTTVTPSPALFRWATPPRAISSNHWD